MLRSLYLVTHSEATHHVENLVGGWYDSSLTARGMDHARRLAAELGKRVSGSGCLLVSSDLRRAKQTAHPIAQTLGVDIVFDADLREQCYGEAEGTRPGSIPFNPPPKDGDRMRHRDGVEGSESRLEFGGRAYAALGRIIDRGYSEAIVVSHGGTVNYLIAAWIGLPLESAGYVKFKVSPGGITHLREDDFFHDRQLVSLNDVDHLR